LVVPLKKTATDALIIPEYKICFLNQYHQKNFTQIPKIQSVNQWHYEWQIGVKTANDALIIPEHKICIPNQ